MAHENEPFEFACPECGSRLDRVSPDEQCCPKQGTRFRQVDGIWRLLSPARAKTLEPFIRQYELVRAAEGRGDESAGYYRALPFADLTGRFAREWQIRARGYAALVARVIAPGERGGAPLKILDLGAGTGWLSYRLSKRGHTLAAVDLLTNRRDGLGARVHYDVAFTSIQADFDCLPLAAGQADVAIFNASFHYSTHYEGTLAAVLHALKPEGTIVILDTPVYTDSTSGRHMVAERQAHFERTFDFPSRAIGGESYMTYTRLQELGRNAGVEWHTHRPFRGWRWALRPWVARLRGGREPAEFLMITGRRKRP